MALKPGDLVPIGEALADLPGPVQVLIPSPPTQRHFTRADQVNQLVGANEADSDLGFMARTMALCSLPRTNPGNRTQYKRVNGPYTLIMSATGVHKLPYGNLPRLILAWLCTEAVRTRSRELVLGRSLSDFMRELDIYAGGGNAHEQRVSPDRSGAVQGAKRRSEPLTARTDLESCEARERGSAVEGVGQTGFEDARSCETVWR